MTSFAVPLLMKSNMRRRVESFDLLAGQVLLSRIPQSQGASKPESSQQSEPRYEYLRQQEWYLDGFRPRCISLHTP